MGRKKLEYKSIESAAKRKTTFSKRINGLRKKADELSVLCKIDIAVIAFSEKGKLYQYCNQTLADFLQRLANLPPAERIEGNDEAEKLFQELHAEKNLEAPTIGYPDLQRENQALKEVEEKRLSDQETRTNTSTDQTENITSMDLLNDMKEKLAQDMQRVLRRTEQLQRETQSFNPSHESFGMGVRGPPKCNPEFFKVMASMQTIEENLQHSNHNVQNLNSTMTQFGKTSENFNLITTQLGETSQNSNNDTNRKFQNSRAVHVGMDFSLQPAHSVQNSNSSMSMQIGETSQRFNTSPVQRAPSVGRGMHMDGDFLSQPAHGGQNSNSSMSMQIRESSQRFNTSPVQRAPSVGRGMHMGGDFLSQPAHGGQNSNSSMSMQIRESSQRFNTSPVQRAPSADRGMNRGVDLLLQPAHGVQNSNSGMSMRIGETSQHFNTSPVQRAQSVGFGVNQMEATGQHVNWVAELSPTSEHHIEEWLDIPE